MKVSRVQYTMIFFILILVFGSAGGASGIETLMKLSVDQAVAIALAENLNLKLQKNEVENGHGTELIEKGFFDPRLEAGVAEQEQWQPSLLTGGLEKQKSALWNVVAKKKIATGTEIGLSWENSRLDSESTLAALEPVYTTGIKISISQPLFKGNSKEVQTAGIRASEKYTAAQAYLVEKEAADLAAQVKKAYWQLVFARQDIEVKKLSLKLAKSLHEEIRRKIENEVMARVEIYQPESEIARREESLIAAEKSIANTEDSLKLLMNSRDWQVAMVPVDIPEAATLVPELQRVLTNALDRRPDILANDLQVDAAEIMVIKAEDDLKPSLALKGAAGINGDGDTYHDTVDAALSESDFSWELGLTLQLPIGNQSARGSLTKARAELARSKFRAELLRQRTEKKVREAVRDVTLAIKTIEATRKTSLAAQKRLEAEQAKFRAGLATANDVLESQDVYARALAGEKRALADLAKARAELDRVQGIVSFRGRHLNDA